MTKINEGAAAVSVQELAVVRSAVRRAKRVSSYSALARASGLTSGFVGLVAAGKKGVTQITARMLLDGAAKVTSPREKTHRPKSSKTLTGEPLEALVRDIRTAIAERFGGSVETLARGVNAPVELVQRLLDGATEIATSDARKFAPFRTKPPVAATAFVSTPLEQARAMLPARLRETHGIEALVHVRAVLSRAEEMPVERSALALVRKWGPEAIGHVLGEVERGLVSMGGA